MEIEKTFNYMYSLCPHITVMCDADLTEDRMYCTNFYVLCVQCQQETHFNAGD